MLRLAVPNKGTLSEPASAMLREAGYRQRTDARDLTVIDVANDVEFFFLRPKDIAIYVGSGELDLGLTGRDLAAESQSAVKEELGLGFGHSSFRYAAPGGRDWTVADLAGIRVATAYPNLVRADLAARGVTADVIRLDGAVEISIQLGVADAIADVVGSGRTLRQHGLVAFGDTICSSEAVVIGQSAAGAVAGRPAGREPAARCRPRPAVPDAGLRLPACASRPGRADHPRARVTHGGPAGRCRLGRRPRDGAPAGRQPGDGRTRRPGRQGDPGVRHPVLPPLSRP